MVHVRREQMRVNTFQLWLLMLLAGVVLFAFWLEDEKSRSASAAAPSLSNLGPIVNPGFDEDSNQDGVPDGWQIAGRSGVVQSLRQVVDPERGKVACLSCTQFEPGYPDSHAMLAQVGTVGLQRGQWYRVRLWARAERLLTGEVQIAIANRLTWQETGFREAFTPSRQWELVEFYFQATTDLAPEDSRLQIWTTGTGVLYVDDISLEPVEKFQPERLPQVSWINPKNAIPNSSFEAGGVGWGCFAPRLGGWGAHVFFLYGRADTSRARHGKTSWYLKLDLRQPLVSYFDYFDPQAEVVDCLLVGHEGWIPVTPGKQYVFACWVTSEQPETPIVLMVVQADGRRIEKRFVAQTEWIRFHLAFTPEKEFVWVGVGPDLRGSNRSQAGVWVDAVQFAQSEGQRLAEVPYEPREAVETFVETPAQGNIFLHPEAGLEVTWKAVNTSEDPQQVKGKLWITDFRDRPVWEQLVTEAIPAGNTVVRTWSHVVPGKKGFYRIHFAREGTDIVRSIRAAVIDPVGEEQETAFGMNHAFGWPELLSLAHRAGLRWWRDWSTQWRLVQKEEGQPFDFSLPRVQIERVIKAGGKVVMLLPFPGTPWAVDADLDRIWAEVGGKRYLAERLQIAQKPRDVRLFGQYVRAAVGCFWPDVETIEVLNEPLFTTYALPATYGHRMEDYLELLRKAYRSAKAVSPDVRVVGGIAAPPDHRFVREFLEKGGAAWCDVVNLHLYPHRGDPLAYEAAFRDHAELLKRVGPQRPVWVTEFGLYADDDPAVRPFRVGDATMTRSLRPNELRASIDLVKFVAMMRAYQVEKIFYHAGIAGAWNADSAGNIFFEYGGTPRKMFAAQAVLARMFPPDLRFVQRWSQPGGVAGFEFIHPPTGQHVVVLWAVEPPVSFTISPEWEGLDLMGNRISDRVLSLDEVPIYLIRKP